jgi:uncharacterized membrane protein YcaP (DUF421 family)
VWIPETPVGTIALRCVVVYLCVLIGFRLFGKREVGQMTPFDLVLILLIANAVQNAMVGPDESLTGGLIAAGTLLLLNFTVGRLVVKSRSLERVIKGRATLLINRGVIQEAHLSREGVTREDLMRQLREHGVATPEEVRLAVLEVDGTLSVIKEDDLTPHTDRPHRRFRFLKRP